MTDQQFRASVRADAIRAGNSPAVAEWLSANVGKVPKGDENSRFYDASVLRAVMAQRPQSRPAPVVMATKRPMTTDESRRVICDLYGASALLPAFVASRLPLPRVAATLANITHGERITPAGIAAVRNQLQALRYWGAAS